MIAINVADMKTVAKFYSERGETSSVKIERITIISYAVNSTIPVEGFIFISGELHYMARSCVSVAKSAFRSNIDEPAIGYSFRKEAMNTIQKMHSVKLHVI